MPTPLLCSNCFRDEGLKLSATMFGVEDATECPRCHSGSGYKLTAKALRALTHGFFVRGTVQRMRYGGAPLLQFNEMQYGESQVEYSKLLRSDVALISEALRIGIFYYGPRLWMLGEVEPLKRLQKARTRGEVIQRVLGEYPLRQLTEVDTFYRLRRAPANPASHNEYDSQPDAHTGKGRLDARGLPVLYASQDIEVCVHECRVTVDDDLYLATLRPTRGLKLLDLTAIVSDEGTEFESIDIATHMLFLAGAHSYHITRDIARTAREAGFDGLIFPSYFSLVRTGAMPFETAYGISVRRFASQKAYAQSQVIPNLAIFGRPVRDCVVRVDCINRVVLRRVAYGVQFGPLIPPQ